MKTKEPKQKNTRVPKQKRSIAKKNLIKSTALLLFSEKSYANISTNEIAKTLFIIIIIIIILFYKIITFEFNICQQKKRINELTS